MARRVLEVERATRLLNHGPTVLVSCAHGGSDNVITLAWTSPVSSSPPLVAVAIAPGRYSHGLIERSEEFGVNVPGSGLLEAVWLCGTTSGRDGDKFERARLERRRATRIAAPLVEDCFAHVECKVVEAETLGDHTLFVGEVVAAAVEREAFDGHLTLRGGFQTLHHLGGSLFVTSAGTRLDAGRRTARA
jgi:flavin reductase (DIM6/NTAB) family NADH-FMN oxidoreductase RutF